MRYSGLKIAILAIVGSVALSSVAWAKNSAVRNCNWCHGTSSAQGYAPAPRLAGQRPQYIENQLFSFHLHTRDNPFSQQYMWAAAANLTQQSARDLSMYYASLPTKAANDGNRGLAATGETIYQQGMPDENIVACVACHGPNAEGVGQIPRLGGLSYIYLKRRLKQWGEGYHAAAPPMPSIAGKLPPELIEALASYLSFIR